LAFLPYPGGFAALSLGERRLPEPVRARLPVAGPLLFAGAIAVLAALAVGGEWPTVAAVPLLFAAGAGHASGFSPLFTTILGRVETRYAATVSGMAATGTLLAGVLAISTLGGVYLAVGSLAPVTALIAALLLLGAGCARLALRAGPR
jgi:hypothetical protein